jgi:transcriptional regulator with XRE-family HTH domain
MAGLDLATHANDDDKGLARDRVNAAIRNPRIAAGLSAESRVGGGLLTWWVRAIQSRLRAMTKETGMLVQKLRLQRGWSQEDLAALSALSVRTIQRIERGHTASMESLKALAAVFEMNPPSAPSVDQDEVLALAHVRRIKGFYRHLLQFAVVIGVLAVSSYVTNPHYPWVLWVALCWGSAVALHGLQAFDKLPFLTAAWERRQVEKYMGRRL